MLYEVVVMEERKKPSIGKTWKYLFAFDVLIIAFILAVLIYLKAIYIP